MQAILHPTDENPSPPGAECITLVTSDKVHLRAMKAVPENARGTVVILGAATSSSAISRRRAI